MKATQKRQIKRQARVPQSETPPPSAGEGEPSPGVQNEAAEPDVLVWRDPRTDPPFDHQAEGRQQHGPFELLLRSHTVVVAPWAQGLTSSGGRAWGWKMPDGRLLPFAGIEGWREILP